MILNPPIKLLTPPCQSMADEMGAAEERKILVAVDESEESMHALSWCLKNVLVSNNPSKDTLILLYVKPPRVVYSSLDGTGRTTNSRDISQAFNI